MTTPMSQLKHSLNTIYVLVDMFANAVPVRLYHMIYPLVVGLAYCLFNVLYFVNDGRGPNGRPYAYDLMDWRNPLGSSVTVLLGLAFIQTERTPMRGRPRRLLQSPGGRRDALVARR